jgi:hypothetical protein
MCRACKFNQAFGVMRLEHSQVPALALAVIKLVLLLTTILVHAVYQIAQHACRRARIYSPSSVRNHVKTGWEMTFTAGAQRLT